MNINFKAAISWEGTLVIGVYEGEILTQSAETIDVQTDYTVKRALKDTSFQGKRGEIFSIIAPHGIDSSRLVLIGLGKKEDLTSHHLEEIGGILTAHLLKTSQTHATFLLEGIDSKNLTLPEIAAHLGFGALLRSFQFDKYRTKPKNKASLTHLDLIVSSSSEVEKAQTFFMPLKSLAEGIFYTRTFVSEPPNVLYPVHFAEELKALSKLGIKVEILGEKQMQALGMNTILGVAQGSVKEPQLVILEWQGAKDQAPVAFIGKGVTFDSGGIGLKPSSGMADMKWDMAGAGTVAGLMKTLALRKASVHAIGVLALVENMPSGTAQRPSDVVKSLSGQTIEILDTDAEGRLILADALWYAQDRYKPQVMIDLATLTGAIIIALGTEYAGLFSNNEDLAHKLYETSVETDEKLWRLPMHEVYDKDINSEIADMKNIGTPRVASSITAAQFLARFVNGVPWAHLDIAGMAWSSKDSPFYAKGATAFGVRLLDRFVSKYYEK